MTSAEKELQDFAHDSAMQHPEDVDRVVEMAMEFMYQEEDRVERFVTEIVKRVCDDECSRQRKHLRRQQPTQEYRIPARTPAMDEALDQYLELSKKFRIPDFVATLEREQEIREETEQQVRRDIELDRVADETANLVTNRHSDGRITWKRNGKLKVNMMPVLASTLKDGESRAEIRRRLKNKISAKLEDHGWVAEGSDVYSHQPDQQA